MQRLIVKTVGLEPFRYAPDGSFKERMEIEYYADGTNAKVAAVYYRQ